MNTQDRKELEYAIDKIDEAMSSIANIRDKEIKNPNFRSTLVIDLEQVLSDIESATNGINYISGNDY